MTRPLLALLAALCLAACSGSGGSTAADATGTSPQGTNVQAVTVDGGPQHKCVNCLFTSVTVCAPGNANYCQTVDGVLVDTGSSGLRLISASGGGQLALNLPPAQSGGINLGECNQFVDSSYTWGALRLADVRLGQEAAADIPITVLSDPQLPNVPGSCGNSGAFDESTAAALGANGILGIGVYELDCGDACTGGSTPPAAYYTCPTAAACAPTFVNLDQQVPNPVARLPAPDNNGVMLRLPAVNASARSVSGVLILGIDSRDNNALPDTAGVFPVNGSGAFKGPTMLAGQPFYQSFIDSGSNGLFFTNVTGIPECGVSQGFYCPATHQSLTAVNQNGSGTLDSVDFQVWNAEDMFASDNGLDWAFGPLAGPYPGGGGFDWGLPFFYGRTVFVAIEHRATARATGPYWAY